MNRTTKKTLISLLLLFIIAAILIPFVILVHRAHGEERGDDVDCLVTEAAKKFYRVGPEERRVILDSMKALLEKHPTNSNVSFTLAKFYDKSAMLEDALFFYSWTIGLVRIDCNIQAVADAHFNRGILFDLVGKQKEAIADFTTVIKLNPDSPFAYNLRGTIFKRQGRVLEAERDFSQGKRLMSRFRNASKQNQK